jgi:hypothetical protein
VKQYWLGVATFIVNIAYEVCAASSIVNVSSMMMSREIRTECLFLQCLHGRLQLATKPRYCFKHLQKALESGAAIRRTVSNVADSVHHHSQPLGVIDHMNTKMLFAALLASLVLAAGCAKKDEAPAEAAQEAAASADSAAASASEAAGDAAGAATDAAEAATDAATAAGDAAAPADGAAAPPAEEPAK